MNECYMCSLMLGFMVTAFLLSMFINNIAATAMLLPIAQGVLDEIFKQENSTKSKDEEVVDKEMEEKGVKCTSFSINPSYESSEELDSSSQLEDQIENKVRDAS